MARKNTRLKAIRVGAASIGAAGEVGKTGNRWEIMDGQIDCVGVWGGGLMREQKVRERRLIELQRGCLIG